MERLEESEIEKIKNEILGKRYELSFSFISKDKIRSLNKQYRKKDEPTDILSFPLDNPSAHSARSGPSGMGEILICKEIAKQKSPEFNMTFQDYLIFLVIHGCLHLKGMKHGAKMTAYELTHHSRHRRRHL